MLASVPPWAFYGALVLVAASAWWYFRERSASGVSRRSRKSSRKAAAGLGGIGVGIVGAIVGVGGGLADTLGQLGDVLLQSPEFLQLAIGAWGWFAIKSGYSATAFAAVAGGIIILGLMVSR